MSASEGYGHFRRSPIVLLLGICIGAASTAFAQSNSSGSGNNDAETELVTSGIAGTCFPQDDNPYAARLAKATLQTHNGLSIFDNFQGTAVVIADSKDESGVNRLLTVAHNLGKRPHRGRHEIQLTASDNTPIGIAVPASLPWRYRKGGSKYDISVLKIVSFASKESEEKYRSIEGIELAPIQAKSGYVQGLVNDPVTPNNGSSGGPIIDETGRLVGLVDFIIMRSKTRKVHALAIGPYAKLSAKDMETPIEGRTFAISVTPHSILRALGLAGQNITAGSPPLSDIILASYPGGYCTYSHGTMAPVVRFNAAVMNFDTPAGQTASQGSFTNWQSPKAAYAEVQRLLTQAKLEHPADEAEIDAALSGLKNFGGIKQVKLLSSQIGAKPDTVTIDTLTDTLRNASKQTHNQLLSKDLLAASERLPISWYIAWRPPMAKRWLQIIWP